MRVLVTGASGAVGSQLIPQLVSRDHSVIATTRSAAKQDLLRSWGAEPVILDGLDGAAVRRIVTEVAPEAIIHEMTALSGATDLRHFDRWFATTNELRTRGTEHLLAAAEASGVKRFVAQSYIGWNNARTGGAVKTEADPLDEHPAAAQRESLAAIRFVETHVPQAPIDGIVVRYGNLYGPGASDSMVALLRKRMLPIVGAGSGVWSWTHIADAASGTVAALERGRPGLYNIVDDEPAPVREWLPYLAEAVGAKPPLRVPVWLGRLVGGDVTVQWMIEGRGASNAKAKLELGWEPIWRSWRTGFREGIAAPLPQAPPAPTAARSRAGR
jgi:2-alkyl-3-oxoalkanoate reductase